MFVYVVRVFLGIISIGSGAGFFLAEQTKSSVGGIGSSTDSPS